MNKTLFWVKEISKFVELCSMNEKGQKIWRRHFWCRAQWNCINANLLWSQINISSFRYDFCQRFDSTLNSKPLSPIRSLGSNAIFLSQFVAAIALLGSSILKSLEVNGPIWKQVLKLRHQPEQLHVNEGYVTRISCRLKTKMFVHGLCYLIRISTVRYFDYCSKLSCDDCSDK